MNLKVCGLHINYETIRISVKSFFSIFFRKRDFFRKSHGIHIRSMGKSIVVSNGFCFLTIFCIILDEIDVRVESLKCELDVLRNELRTELLMKKANITKFASRLTCKSVQPAQLIFFSLIKQNNRDIQRK